MADAHKNFAYSLVATAPSPASSGTSLVVTAADGTKFPAVPFNATIWPTGVQPTAANAEIVRVTAISTDTLTITRAQEGSSARTVVIGDQIAATITALTLTDVELLYGLEEDGNGDMQPIVSTSKAVNDDIFESDANGDLQPRLGDYSIEPGGDINFGKRPLATTSWFNFTNVFNGTAPTAWTNLDLSPFIGTGNKMVVLRVTQGNPANLTSIWFRQNGDTVDYTLFNPGNGDMGIAFGRLTSTIGAGLLLLVPTDASGVVQWTSSAASVACTVDVVAYW